MAGRENFVGERQEFILNKARQLRYITELGLDVYSSFYPRDAMLARVIATATCLSVRLSVVRHAPVLCQNEES